MLPHILSDIFIGNFPETQAFGANPQVYSTLYGIKGHNGLDFGCPTNTMVLSAADGFVSEVGIEALETFDTAGFGRYVKIVHNGFLTLYAHLNDIMVNKGDRVAAGQLIAHSNSTGNSDRPHLHFGVAPCDAAGNKTDKNNGYSGYIDPNGLACKWQIKNLAAPVVPGQTTQETQPVLVSPNDFTLMVSQGTNYKVIASYLMQNGLNAYLAANKLPPVDLMNNPKDPAAGENIIKFLESEFALKTSNSSIFTDPPLDLNNLPQDKKNSFLSGVTGLLQTIGILAKS